MSRACGRLSGSPEGRGERKRTLLRQGPISVGKSFDRGPWRSNQLDDELAQGN